jgi:hypothetical protein
MQTSVRRIVIIRNHLTGHDHSRDYFVNVPETIEEAKELLGENLLVELARRHCEERAKEMTRHELRQEMAAQDTQKARYAI